MIISDVEFNTKQSIQDKAGDDKFVDNLMEAFLSFKSVLASMVAASFEKHSEGPAGKLKQFYNQAIDSFRDVEQPAVIGHAIELVNASIDQHVVPGNLTMV